MTIETEKDALGDSLGSSSYVPRTPLGERLIAIRAKIEAKNEPLLNWEEIEKEVAARRGGYENNSGSSRNREKGEPQ